ncbi:MAG: tRNA dihydrouridine synthase DusB [Ruminococcaceae bacterium]|nr:tRNA dihydrouridine synthase DusB [Oscillospiraceae bacterium]
MKIGNVVLRHGIALAPMAGFSDYAMRRICFEFGAEYSVTEMVSAKATVYKDKKTLVLAKITREEAPTAIQIFGSEPDIMAEAAGILSSFNGGGALPVAIDINMGCPVHKIFSNGEGSALMRNPSLIYDITRAVANATPLPTTVKIRLGIDIDNINAVECALAAEEAGARALTVHGRTKSQLYSGEADMEKVADVKKSVHIPMFANGDIRSAEDAVRVLRDTGADGIMIGRGAIGNPFLFSEITKALRGEDYTAPTLEEIKKTALLQLDYAIADKGETVAVREARGQLAKFFHSFRGSAELRARINLATVRNDVLSALNEVI